MRVLIVGGTGLIGGETALQLAKQGYEVSLMARKPAVAKPLQAFDFIAGDYINDTFDDALFSDFDCLVFAAAADIRNVPQDGSVSPDDFYQQANDVAVPQFIAQAKQAGVKKAVYIGTFYPQVAPQQIGQCAYVSSRHNTCENVLALADESFSVCAINAPFVLGYIEGLPVPHIDALVHYAKGNLAEMPVFAPQGGTNHISAKSLAEAVAGAFKQGTSGYDYLVGDVNLSWKEYLELWFNAAGNAQQLPVLEDEHPMFPNIIQFAGVGATVSYEPDAKTMSDLAYSRNQIKALVETIVASQG